MRLSPYFPDWFLAPLGEGYWDTGQIEKACRVYEHFAARNSDSLLPLNRLAALYRELGDTTRAKRAAETVLSINPDFSVAQFLAHIPYRQESKREKLAALLRQAGLPD